MPELLHISDLWESMYIWPIHNAFAMTTEEKKIEIIGKIISLKDDYIIDAVNEILNNTHSESKNRKFGWGRGMIT